MGPFGSTCDVPSEHVGALVGAITDAAIGNGATHVSIHVERRARRASATRGTGRGARVIDPNPLIRAIRPVVDAVGATFVPAAEAEASDVPIVWDGRTIAAVRMPPLHGALDRLIDAVEAELGGATPVAVARGQAACGAAARRARGVHPAPCGRGRRRRDGREPHHGLQLPERHPSLSAVAEPTVPSPGGRRIDDFDVVAFDADDTLWRSEDSFESAERRFVELVGAVRARRCRRVRRVAGHREGRRVR